LRCRSGSRWPQQICRAQNIATRIGRALSVTYQRLDDICLTEQRNLKNGATNICPCLGSQRAMRASRQKRSIACALRRDIFYEAARLDAQQPFPQSARCVSISGRTKLENSNEGCIRCHGYQFSSTQIRHCCGVLDLAVIGQQALRLRARAYDVHSSIVLPPSGRDGGQVFKKMDFAMTADKPY